MAKRENEYHSLKDLMKVVIKENNLTKGMRQMDVRENLGEIDGKWCNVLYRKCSICKIKHWLLNLNHLCLEKN